MMRSSPSPRPASGSPLRLVLTLEVPGPSRDRVWQFSSPACRRAQGPSSKWLARASMAMPQAKLVTGFEPLPGVLRADFPGPSAAERDAIGIHRFVGCGRGSTCACLILFNGKIYDEDIPNTDFVGVDARCGPVIPGQL